MILSPIDFLVDPVLRAPTIGSMLMCLASSLVGVVVFIRKRSLLGEALSHASYPGVVIGVVLVAAFFPNADRGVALGILIGAFLSGLLGLWIIDLLEKRFHVKNDAALCLVLSVFFGIGVLIASRIQITHALWYKQIQLFLYGQTATMTDVHIFIYSALSLITIFSLIFLYRCIEIINFDRDFAKSIGVRVRTVESALFFLLVLAIVIGIRSVGVVLMSGMLIAPAVAARQYTHSLFMLFILSGFFGLLSGFFGNYFSLVLPEVLNQEISLPTGPMILLTASAICFFSILFAPGCGLLSRFFRILKFRKQCLVENTLKAFREKGWNADVSPSDLHFWRYLSHFRIWLVVEHLVNQGWLIRINRKSYRLTPDGWERASRIVRLHRLWEVYLVDYLGQRAEKVHRNAEEMEHIITPELEKELTELLGDPKEDPHRQPIPAKGSKGSL